MYRRATLSLLASLTLALGGCELLGPDDPVEDAGGDPDAGSDCPDQGHGGEDASVDAGGPDADQDAGALEPSACVGAYATNPTIDPDEGSFSQTWVITCDREPTPDEFGEAVLLERADGGGIQEVSFGGLSCRPGAPDGVTCELTLDGITARAVDAGGVLGEVDLIAYAASPGAQRRTRPGAVRRLRNRYRLSSTRVAGAQRPRDLTTLPAGFAERGVDVRPLATAAGRVAVGAMYTTDGAELELFSVSPDGTTRVLKNQPAGGFEAGASGLTVARVGDGVGVIWWRHDPATGALSAILASLTAEGAPVEVDETDPTSYVGPGISSLHGVDVGLTRVGLQARLTARALALTDRGTLALVRLGDADGAARLSLALEVDAIDGLPASTLEPGTFGLLSSGDLEADLEDRPATAWIARPDGTLTSVGMEDPTRRAQADCCGVQWPFTLDLDAHPAGFTASLTRPDGETRAFTLGATDGGLLDGTSTELAAPGFGLDGSCGFVVEDLQIAFARCAHPALGGAPVLVRWDLSRRDAQERAPVTYVSTVTPGVRGARAGRGDRVVSWVNGDDTLETSGTDLLCGTTDHLRLGEDEQGPSICGAPVGGFSPGGYRVEALPGQTGLTWAVDKYGDILIDGVPLVFDLVAPPIVFDTPGAQGHEAMVLATIDHPAATHVVWGVGADGALSEPGLLDMQRATEGAGRETYVSASADLADTGGVLTTSICHFSVAPGDGPPTVVTASVEALANAIGSPEPVSIETRATEGLPQATASIALLAPAGLAPEVSALEPLPDSASLLATLTPEQALRPLLVTRADGTVTVWAQGADGALAEVATVEGARGGLSGAPFTLFASDEVGDGDEIDRRLRRYKNKHKKVQLMRRSRSSSTAGAPSTTYALVLTTYPDDALPASATSPEVGDFNGDGLLDAVVTPDGGPAAVYFDDGAGASLPAPLDLPGGPTVTWPPATAATAATAGNGKGTRKASAQVGQQQIPLL